MAFRIVAILAPAEVDGALTILKEHYVYCEQLTLDHTSGVIMIGLAVREMDFQQADKLIKEYHDGRLELEMAKYVGKCPTCSSASWERIDGTEYQVGLLVYRCKLCKNLVVRR